MQTVGYLKRSWEALRLNPNWWKTIAILALASFIPIIGPIAVYGYLYRWGREAAWDMEQPITSKVGKLGTVLKSGAIVFVCLLVWGCVLGLAGVLLGGIPYVGDTLSSLWSIACIFLLMVVQVMAMRGVIYDSFEPMLQVRQAWDMVRREPNGLFRVLGIAMVFNLIVFVLSIPLVMWIAMILFVGIARYGYGNPYLSSQMAGSTAGSMGAMVPVVFALMIVVFLAVLFVSMLGQVLATRALGYWVGQFKPGTWGASSAGAPASVGPQRVAQGGYQYPPQGAAPYQQATYQNPVTSSPGEQAAAWQSEQAQGAAAAGAQMSAAAYEGAEAVPEAYADVAPAETAQGEAVQDAAVSGADMYMPDAQEAETGSGAVGGVDVENDASLPQQETGDAFGQRYDAWEDTASMQAVPDEAAEVDVTTTMPTIQMPVVDDDEAADTSEGDGHWDHLW